MSSSRPRVAAPQLARLVLRRFAMPSRQADTIPQQPPGVNMIQRRRYQGLLLAFLLPLAGCVGAPEDQDMELSEHSPSGELGVNEAALTGAPITSIPALTQRNAIVTQPFGPSLVTPDGRVGFSVDSDTVGRIYALGDPLASVSSGAPRFASQMATHSVTVSLPAQSALNEMTSSTAIANGGTGGYGHHRVPQGTALRPWRPSGAGALVHDPRYSPAGKPFPVLHPDDCKAATPATREALSNPHGRFDCYRLLHYQPYEMPPNGAFPLFQGQLYVIVDARRPDHRTDVVARSSNPTVVEARYTVPLSLATSGFHIENGKTIAHFLHSLESSATADGRVFVAEMGIWSYNETPWLPTTWLEPRPIEDRIGHNGAIVRGLYGSMAAPIVPNDPNPLPAVVTQHRKICRRIDPAAGTTTCTAAQEEDFWRVYPVAAQPFYRTDGKPATDLPVGYTWISPEGTDIFARINPNAMTGGQRTDGLAVLAGFESSTGMQFFSMGQHTNWMVRRIDGGVNIRRFNPERLECMMFGHTACEGVDDRPFSPIFLNTSSGFWAENRRAESQSLPILRQPSVFQFMTQNNAIAPEHAGDSRTLYEQAGLLPSADTSVDSRMQYWEASFACSISPNCLLHLTMNEFAYDVAAPAAVHTTALPETHDASNNTDFRDRDNKPLPAIHPYVGRLNAGARFIGEVRGVFDDESYLSGFRGTGISFTSAGAVSVAAPVIDWFPNEGRPGPECTRNKGCLDNQSYTSGFTAELAFLPLFAPGSANVPLAKHHGVWEMRLVNGRVQASLSYLTSSGAGSVALTSPASVSSSQVTASPGVQAPLWTHVALRHDPKAGPVTSSGLSSRVTLLINGTAVATTTLPAGAAVAKGQPGTPDPVTSDAEILRVGPAGQCTGCPAGQVLFMDEVLVHKTAVRDEDIAASAGKLAARASSFFASASQARSFLASYFSMTNPRGLTLAADGFPLFLQESELRIPIEFQSFTTPAGLAKVRTLVDLGATLFSSPVLSTSAAGQSQLQAGTGQPMSCATCHKAERAFTDGLTTAVGVQSFPVNTPTIVNRALGTSQFMQRTATSLVDLALRPVIEAREMNGNLTQILQRINSAPDQATLRQAFATVFTLPVTADHIALALTAFQLVQLSVDSLADTIISTNNAARDASGVLLTPQGVKLGKELFEGKARCSACHVGTNFSDELLHDTGVTTSTPGAFKTPTLWDVGATGPYFHDGSVATLRGVLDFYNKGGNGTIKSSLGVRVVDPELRPLALNDVELNALEMYLRGLTNAGPRAMDNILDMAFSSNGPVPGLFCTPVIESDTGWSDNYLCSASDRGVRFSASGAIAGMTCIAMTEPNEDPIWSDDVLCFPPGSIKAAQWSYSGPVAGKACVKFDEPEDRVDTWNDNYFCFDPALATELITPTLMMLMGWD